MKQIKLFGTSLQYRPQRSDRQHGELLYLVRPSVIFRIEYDRDGDLIFSYGPSDLDKKVYVKVIYLSKIWKRKCAN